MAGFAGWYVWKDFHFGANFNQSGPSNQQQGLIVDQTQNQDSSTTSTDVSKLNNAVRTENVKLKTLALKIISEPIIFKTSLSEDSKKLFTQKINEIHDLVKQDYNYLNQWLDLGSYRKLIGDYEGAIEALNFAVAIRPDDYVAFHNLGDLYGFYLKNYPKAEENFLKSITFKPANEDAYIQLATIYQYSYKEKSGETENILLKGISSNPGSATLKIALGNYYKTIGRNTDALKYFEDALKLMPNNVSLQQDIELLKKSI